MDVWLYYKVDEIAEAWEEVWLHIAEKGHQDIAKIYYMAAKR